MEIKGFISSSLIDYPEKICSVLFVGKCNFRCPYCFNPELVLDYDKMETIDEEKVWEYLKPRRKWIDGVAIIGGEPTLHKNLGEFLKKIKSLGLLVKIDTNGTNPDFLKELIDKKLIDYIAMDIKAPLEKYERVINAKVDLNKIKKSVKVIKNSGIEYEFRTTIIPGLINEKDILEISKFLKGSKKYCLQQFKPEKTLDNKFQDIDPYSPEKLLEFKKIAEPFFEIVKVRGI